MDDELKIDLTSNPLVSSAIFFEYSRSATRTLFSICSVFAWTSFLTAISLSTAASKERMNGFGSNAMYVTLSDHLQLCSDLHLRPLSAFDFVISFSDATPTNSVTSNFPFKIIDQIAKMLLW